MENTRIDNECIMRDDNGIIVDLPNIPHYRTIYISYKHNHRHKDIESGIYNFDISLCIYSTGNVCRDIWYTSYCHDCRDIDENELKFCEVFGMFYCPRDTNYGEPYDCEDCTPNHRDIYNTIEKSEIIKLLNYIESRNDFGDKVNIEYRISR